MSQTGLQSLGGNINAKASQYIGSYNSNVLNGSAKTLHKILLDAGAITGDYAQYKRADWGTILSDIDKNPQLSQKVLASIGLGTSAQKQSFANKTFGPASGSTPASRDANPNQALTNLGMSSAQIANVNAGGSPNAAPTGTATLNQASRTLATDAPTAQPGTSSNTGVQGIKRIGNDFFAILTNGQEVPLDENSAFAQGLGINADFVPSGSTVSLQQAREGNTSSGAGDYTNIVKKVLDGLAAKGLTINPNVQMTPERAAEFLEFAEAKAEDFLSKAEKEIAPYYQGQMKLAREKLYSELNYSAEQISLREKDMERQYGQAHRKIGEDSADVGFAQSGIRQREEGNLAYNTQRDIDTGRSELSYAAGNAGRGYAQQWGSKDIPNVKIANAPRVLGGQGSFAPQSGNRNLYQLSDDVYSGLTGEQEWLQRADIKATAAEFARNKRTVDSATQPV